MATVSAIIVSYSDPQATRAAVASLRAQTAPLHQVIVVDNHPDGLIQGIDAIVVRPGRNLGYPGGVRAGVARADGEWLLLLNPDAVAEPDCVERLLEGADDDVGVVGAQVLRRDGLLNAGDNPLHITGISWSGRYGQPPEDGPPRSVAVASGAAQIVRRALWDQVEGMADRYFLYHEDVDFCWRARLSGWDVRLAPAARVVHDYSFDKGAEKWFWLERNRAWTVLCNYGTRSLALLAPVLVAAEVAIALRSRREGWWPQKRRAWQELWSERAALCERRREVQASRRRGDKDMLELMTGAVSGTPGDAAIPLWAAGALEAYRCVVALAVGTR